jgi:hypothetical protein
MNTYIPEGEEEEYLSQQVVKAREKLKMPSFL